MNTSDSYRKKRAKELRLPEAATWADINAHNSDISRRERAKELGLPEAATWEQIAHRIT